MGTSSDKHERQKLNKSRLEAALRERDAKARQRKMLAGGLVVVAILVAIAALVFMTKGSEDDDVASGPGSSAETTESTDNPEPTDEPAAAELPDPAQGETLSSATECPPADGSASRVQKFAGPPPDCLDPGVQYSAIFDTTEGSFTATLDRDDAPEAVNNFVVLSRYHFYDGVPFHRIIPGFVIQSGDGDGDPWGNNDLGYQFEDELPADSSAYTDYSLAMANAGPDTNGSQFFVVLPGGGSKLQPLYTSFGQVTDGQDVVDRIGELSDGQENPTKVVLINSVTITTR